MQRQERLLIFGLAGRNDARDPQNDARADADLRAIARLQTGPLRERCPDDEAAGGEVLEPPGRERGHAPPRVDPAQQLEVDPDERRRLVPRHTGGDQDRRHFRSGSEQRGDALDVGLLERRRLPGRFRAADGRRR